MSKPQTPAGAARPARNTFNPFFIFFLKKLCYTYNPEGGEALRTIKGGVLFAYRF